MSAADAVRAAPAGLDLAPAPGPVDLDLTGDEYARHVAADGLEVAWMAYADAQWRDVAAGLRAALNRRA